MMKPLLILTAFLIGFPAFGQSTWRNFFTTNQNPIVEVVAGSNATVQASTVGVNLRRFTVNGTGSGSGSGQTNWPWQSITNVNQIQIPYASITNARSQWPASSITNAGNIIYSNASDFYLNSNPSNYITSAQVPAQTNISWQSITNISSVQIPLASITNAQNLTNWALIPTNYVPPQTSHATNSDFANFSTNSTTSGFVTNATLTNQIYGSNIVGNIQPTDISTYRQTATFFDDFLYGTVGTGPAGNGTFGFISTVSSGSIGVPSALSSHPGVILLRSGGSSGNSANVAPVINFGASLLLGSGSGVITNEWCFRLTNTVTTADGGMFRVGLTPIPISSFTETANGLYIRYNTNNTTFQYVAASGSSYTTNDSTVTVVANTWYRARIVITNASSATFTINDSNSWTATNNIPTVSIAPNWGVLKAAGASQLGCEMDYCYLGYTLILAR